MYKVEKLLKKKKKKSFFSKLSKERIRKVK